MDVLTIIKQHIEEIKNKFDPKYIKKLDLPLTDRIAARLAEFSNDCKTCSQLLTGLEAELNNLLENQNLEKEQIRAFKKNQHAYISHLSKEHKLVREGQYVATYMSIGVSLGLVFGMITFDNIALGLPIGIAVGVAIGSGKDADAKKKGLVI